MSVRKPTVKDVKKIADSRTGWRSDQPDAYRQERKRFLSDLVKQTFTSKFLFELLERELERAKPLRQELADDELVLATAFIDTDFAKRNNLLAIGQFERNLAGAAAKQHGR